MTLLSAIASLTPTLDDYVYAVDADLGGSPTEQADGRTTFTAIRNLLQANLTTATITVAAANTAAIASTGYSLTGSDATSMIDLAGTLNTTGAPSVLKVNLTNTASAATTKFIDFQRSASRYFSVNIAGNAQAKLMQVASDGSIGFSSTTAVDGAADVFLKRDAANSLAMRNSTTAQAFRVYNTYTDASNNEWGGFAWTSNELVIGAVKNGTGSLRNVVYVGGSHTFYQTSVGIRVFNFGRSLDLTSNGVTTFKSLHKLALNTSGQLTIATGVIAPTGIVHRVDTEGDAASDDLDTITASYDGQMLIIRPENSARTVVAKDGTGNLALSGDFSMDNEQDTLTLIYNSDLALWLEISRSDNGA